MTTNSDLKSTKFDSKGKSSPPPLPAKSASKSTSEASSNLPSSERKPDSSRGYMNYRPQGKIFAATPVLTLETFISGCREELPLLASWFVLIVYLGTTYCRHAEQVKILRGEVTYNKQTLTALIDEQSKKCEHYFQTTLKLGEDMSDQKLHIEEVEAHWRFVTDKQTATIEKLRADVETTNRLIAQRIVTPGSQDSSKPALTQTETPAPALSSTTTVSPTTEPMPVEKSAPSLSVNDSPVESSLAPSVTEGQSAEEAASTEPLVAANRPLSSDSNQK
jgi:hypothetical protein